jgi:hypothetical protein
MSDDRHREMCNNIGKTKQQNSAASDCYREPVDLLTCDRCGADPAKFCVVDISRGREPHDPKSVWAECKQCGYSVSARNVKHPAIIRDLWNVRTR